MPIQGPQQPGFWLPGSEYFSLAPNTTIALQGRRRFRAVSPTFPAPASTDGINGNASFVIESNFSQTSGIYLHWFQFGIGPNLPGLTLNNAVCGLSVANPASPDYQLGLPIITTQNFFIGANILTDQQRLICAKDIIGGVNTTLNLSLVTQINVNNPDPVANAFLTVALIIYTRLDGLLE